jgi:hypothetical protein
MSPWGQPDTFVIEKPNTEAFAPVGGWGETVPPVSPWAMHQQSKPSYADDESLKKQFGIELAKCKKPFEAACYVFETDTSAALWIATNWINDPIVIAAKDVYLKTVKAENYLLDKDGFAAMLMETALETELEDKEKINILKLYAEVRGFLNKNETNINNFNNNEGLKIVFVKSDDAQPKVKVPNLKSEILNDDPLSLKIKLVGNG